MVLVLGPKFRIPTQIFKCQSGLCGGVLVLGERQVATCHISQLLGYLLYLDSKHGRHTWGLLWWGSYKLVDSCSPANPQALNSRLVVEYSLDYCNLPIVKYLARQIYSFLS